MKATPAQNIRMPARMALRMTLLIVLLASIATATLAASSRSNREPEATPPQGYVPSSVLTRPVPLRSDIGNAHEAAGTASSKAQRYYDQGLGYLDSYVWIEAARSFHEALRLDPGLTLAVNFALFLLVLMVRPTGIFGRSA